MNIDDLDSIEIFKLLEACDELDFNELIDNLQNHLLNNEKEWIQHNLVRLNQISSKHHSFGLLQGYCKKIFENDPIASGAGSVAAKRLTNTSERRTRYHYTKICMYRYFYTF